MGVDQKCDRRRGANIPLNNFQGICILYHAFGILHHGFGIRNVTLQVGGNERQAIDDNGGGRKWLLRQETEHKLNQPKGNRGVVRIAIELGDLGEGS